MSIFSVLRPRKVGVDVGQPFALVDVETTGLNAQSDRVVQIAIRHLDKHGRLEGSWQTLINPNRDPGPTDIHGITAKMLVGAPTYRQVAPTVAALLRGRVLVAHNAVFDSEFLYAEAERAGAVVTAGQRLCTLALAQRLDLRLPNLRLETLASWADVKQRNAHTADDDVLVLQGIFLKLAKRALRSGAPIRLGLDAG